MHEDDEDDEETDDEAEGEESSGRGRGRGRGKDEQRNKDEPKSSREVTDAGYSITKEGMDRFMHITEEQGKRDQGMHGMYIYNGWSGCGMTEVLENTGSVPHGFDVWGMEFADQDIS